jgi:hypothetical protein
MIGLSLFDGPLLANSSVAPPGIVDATDDMDSYAANDDLDGLNGGTNWNAAYASRSWPMPTDDMQSYAATDDLDGLNGGTDWNGGYASR